jgi:hypothetical protein
MSKPTPYARELQAFPAALRELVEAELGAGNSIVEIASTFPAPPAGAYVKLSQKVTTRARASWAGVNFYDRNTSSYSGEFADERRFFFVLEPPNPPEIERNMDEIRAEMQAREHAANTDRFARENAEFEEHLTKAKQPASARTEDLPERVLMRSVHTSRVVERFRASMNIDYERWREGIGYDLEALKSATPAEREQIENLLLPRAGNDWRDVEALAALDSPRAHAALRKVMKSDQHEVCLAVAEHAPRLVSDAERTRMLVRAIESADITTGLSTALRHIEKFHPREVIEALLQGVLSRDGGLQIHFVAMLMYLHKRAKSTFDWDQRPWFLKFATLDRAERVALFRELCEKLRVDPEPYVRRSTKR